MVASPVRCKESVWLLRPDDLDYILQLECEATVSLGDAMRFAYKHFSSVIKCGLSLSKQVKDQEFGPKLVDIIKYIWQ